MGKSPTTNFQKSASRFYRDCQEDTLIYMNSWFYTDGPPFPGVLFVSLDEYMKALNDLQKEYVEAFVRKNMSKENISVAIIGEMTPSQKKKTEKMIENFSM